MEAESIHKAKEGLDKLSNPALEVTKLLIPRACNDIPGSSPLLISYRKLLTTSLLPARSLCLRQVKTLHSVVLAVS